MLQICEDRERSQSQAGESCEVKSSRWKFRGAFVAASHVGRAQIHLAYTRGFVASWERLGIGLLLVVDGERIHG